MAAYLAAGVRQHKYKKQNFSGIERIPVYNKYLYHLRPWDSSPSPVYVEQKFRKQYWYTNPPSFRMVIFILLAMIVLHFAVAFLPIVSARNGELMRLRWQMLQKPAWSYEQGWFLLSAWMVTHSMQALACWFVYLDGGFLEHWPNYIPYAALLLLESIWPDVIFRTRWLSWTLVIWIMMTILCAISFFTFIRVGVVSGFFLLPTLCMLILGTVMLAYFVELNGARYEIIV
eukprot:NODE_1547_length_818_cov_91.946454_g1499_i0.p1 GENE.NODE_1547_length_818_cov_91.946454_g1499_i0~~NODE_1547_length_818_cov_91.946454_g1499_i0.p1  ORF type:complete len:230 (+),score=20.03 NODE_1547_length_818_cov_91.946454_g1499_i0:83-772(+)